MGRRDVGELTDRQVPEVAAALARAVDSGATVHGAIAEVAGGAAGPLGDDLRRVVVATERGVPLGSVLDGWAGARDVEGVTLLAAALRVGHAEGGDVASGLDAVAAAVSDRLDVEDEARSLGTQARSSAVALTLLPPLGAGAFALLDPEVARTLVATTLGRACLLGGVVMDLLGWLAMKALTARMLR
jgi:tight adherence protein B